MQLVYTVKQGTSTQEWLGTVQLCPNCGGQKPKATFRRIDGVDVCLECQQEHDDLVTCENLRHAAHAQY